MGMNINFLKQAQELQQKIKKLQDDLANKTVAGSD
jgi:DNA-binding protein YbaB